MATDWTDKDDIEVTKIRLGDTLPPPSDGRKSAPMNHGYAMTTQSGLVVVRKDVLGGGDERELYLSKEEICELYETFVGDDEDGE